MADFTVLRQKTYSYLTDGNDKNKKAKGTKMYVIKRILKFEDYKSQQRHNVFTEEFNKTIMSANYDKRMQSIDSIETYAYGMSKDLACKKQEINYNNITKQHKND